MITLRLHASYGAKITKNQTPWYVLLDLRFVAGDYTLQIYLKC